MKKIDEADLIIEDDLGYSIYKNFFKDQVCTLIATCSIEDTLFCIRVAVVKKDLFLKTRLHGTTFNNNSQKCEQGYTRKKCE